MSKHFTNSIGMTLIDVEPGCFMMGQAEGGDWDERPAHQVHITQPFAMATTPVTNAQYEQFDPEHRELRGVRGLSKEDDEAVVFVGWHDAVAFCQWLSEKEGKPHRLPTEAEWEYACRAGTTTAFHTGEELPSEHHRHQEVDWDPAPVSLVVSKAPPNPWGLHGMHGNVEEWCHDWYGPYEAAEQTDPVGRVAGEMKVTRGGSHNAEVYYLRSGNRLGTLPEDKHWMIGFRVVMGALPATEPLPAPDPPQWARDVQQAAHDWSDGPDPSKPYFSGPRRFVHIPPDSNGPLFSQHNHCPSITWCPNGDLLAVWFSTNTERGREMTIAASRLGRGSDEWEPAAEFFKAPDRNMTGSALLNDGKGTLFYFNGLEADSHWANLALVMRTSTDSGATWSKPRLINPHHQPRNQVINGTLMTKEGYFIQPCDAVHGGTGGTAIHISRDGGETWVDPGAGTPKPDYQGSEPGGTIAGIHAGIVELADGSLMAFGRGDNRLGSNDNIGERMPRSVSSDLGQSWTYSASEFPPLTGGQRLVLKRLADGPVLFVSFTDPSQLLPDKVEGLPVRDAAGKERRIFGLFATLSFDEGKTWPIRKPVTPGGRPQTLDGGAWTRGFAMDATHAEPRGYLAVTQTPDGVIHLVSSALHYEFNVAWLKEPTAIDGG